MASEPAQRAYRPTGHIALRHIGEDRLLAPATGAAASGCSVFPLNETGAAVWNALTAGCTVGQAADRVAQTFAVETPQALRDCAEFAENLVAQRLLERIA